MKAIIFAAGMSSRLNELTKALPKSCLKLTDDTTMLERNLLLLEQAGVKEVFIVVGHAHEHVNQLIQQNTERFDVVCSIFNPHYHDKNNIFTAYLVKNIIDDQTLILNSDLVLSKDIIVRSIQEISTSDRSFMVVDDHSPVDEESMKVYADSSGKISRVNKALDLDVSVGEFIGAMCIRQGDLPLFVGSMESILSAELFDLYYEDAIDRMLEKSNISLLSTNGKPWTEVDTLDDLNIAKAMACDLAHEI